jgi:hypothetical protein
MVVYLPKRASRLGTMDVQPPDLGDDIRYLAREQLTSVIIKSELQVWDGLKGSAELMAKADVDPFALKPWLPYLTHFRVSREPVSPALPSGRHRGRPLWQAGLHRCLAA